MNRKTLREDNRGAALVSIMIAVTFISILASTLLYLSYNNFSMKVTSYKSKLNFYETEQKMTELSSGLRNDVMKSSNPLDQIKSIAGVNPTTNRYSPEKLAKIVFPAGTVSNAGGDAVSVIDEGDVYTFSSAVTGPNYSEVVTGNITKITLSGVRIRQLQTAEHFDNTITTDLVMYIEESNSVGDVGGIGEFSLLMDAPISCDTGSGATKLNILGNCIAVGTQHNGSESLPGSGANAGLALGGECTVNVLGDYMIVYGDVVLNDSAILNVMGGSLTVYGDIYLNGNSTLMCTGTITLPEGTDSRDGSTYDVILPTGQIAAQHILPADYTVSRLPETQGLNLRNSLGLTNSDPDDDGVVAQITKEQTNKEGSQTVDFDEDGMGDHSVVGGKGIFNGVQYTLKIPNDTNLNGSVKNSLVFIYKDGTTMEEGNINSTVISRKPIKFSQVHTVTVTKMGTQTFNYFIMTDKTDALYDSDVHEFKGRWGTFQTGGFFNSNANDYVQQVIGFASNSSGEKIYSSAIGYENWTKD